MDIQQALQDTGLAWKKRTGGDRRRKREKEKKRRIGLFTANLREEQQHSAALAAVSTGHERPFSSLTA